jgi:hypothetical protein
MLMRGLAWWQAGQVTGVPIVFPFAPRFKMRGLLSPAAAWIS